MPEPRRIGALALSGVVLAALAAAPSATAAAKGFEFGVAAGDVTDSSAILWAKAKKSGDALIQVTRKGGFGKCDLDEAPNKLVVEAKKSNDNTVQKRVSGLDPGESYRYRFCMENRNRSATGKFETAPDPKQKQTVRFALTGDQDARPEGGTGSTTPYWNNFEVWDRIRAQRNDFNVLLGDTIYSDTSVPGYGVGDVALSVPQKWAAYKTNLAMKPWAKARGSASYYAHWDDHEFINDFSPQEDTFPLGVGTVNTDGEALYDRGVDAFRDYNPVAYKQQTGIYRSVRWGKNLEIFFLDERSFRSTSADYQGACDNPPGSGDPDLAPTAPSTTRSNFAPLIPQFNNPPPPGCLERINDPNRTLLGRKQLARFKKEIANSDATFKVVFNEVPIQQFYALPYDRWEGYAAEREAVLRHLQGATNNVVFLTADVHATLINDARFRTLESGGPENSGILEATTGPVATAPFGTEVSDAIGNPNGGQLVHDGFFKPQPPDGVGMACASLDQYSYLEGTATKSELRLEFLDSNDQPVQDTGDSDSPGPPCPPIVIPK